MTSKDQGRKLFEAAQKLQDKIKATRALRDGTTFEGEKRLADEAVTKLTTKLNGLLEKMDPVQAALFALGSTFGAPKTKPARKPRSTARTRAAKTHTEHAHTGEAANDSTRTHTSTNDAKHGSAHSRDGDFDSSDPFTPERVTVTGDVVNIMIMGDYEGSFSIVEASNPLPYPLRIVRMRADSKFVAYSLQAIHVGERRATVKGAMEQIDKTGVDFTGAPIWLPDEVLTLRFRTVWHPLHAAAQGFEGVLECVAERVYTNESQAVKLLEATPARERETHFAF